MRVRNNVDDAIVEVSYPVVAPYEVFHALYKAGPAQFLLSMCGSNTSLSCEEYSLLFIVKS